MRLFEIYSEPNSALLRHLRNDDIDPYRLWHYFADWVVDDFNNDGDLLSELEKAAGEDLHADDSDDIRENILDLEPEVFYRLSTQTQKDFQEHFETHNLHQMFQDEPTEVPSKYHFSLDDKRLLKRLTWLVHFSDDAYSIARNGFSYGMDDMDRLGLTTHFTDHFRKRDRGYNFAFEANSHYAKSAARIKRYGKNAVLFQNSGVKTHHYADEEQQIIFWGADVKPSNIILLQRDYEDSAWAVMRHPSHSDGVLYKADSYESAVKWVVSHHQQYRRYIYG